MTWNTLGPGQPEVGQFQFAHFADEQVLRFHVPVQNSSLMAIGKPPQQLKQEQPHVPMVQSTRMPFHVLREVGILWWKKMEENGGKLQSLIQYCKLIPPDPEPGSTNVRRDLVKGSNHFRWSKMQ